MIKITLKVEGMMCEGCENRIKNILTSLEKIKEVEADYKTKKVTIISEVEISKEEIRDLLEDIGFNIIEEE